MARYCHYCVSNSWLPFSAFFAWAYELTPEGIKPAHEVEPSESITHVTGQKFNIIIMSVMALAIAFLFIDNYVLVDEPQTAVIEPVEEVARAVEAVEEVPAPIDEEPQREVLPNSIA